MKNNKNLNTIKQYPIQITEADNKKEIKIDDIIKTFKLFKPEQAITFLAKQYDMEPSEFLAKKFLKIAAYAVKNGLVKTADLTKSAKDIMKKNIKDNTEIDYDNLELDPDTVKIKTLFGGKDNKVLIDFINNFAEEMKDIDSDIEKAQKTVITDAKKRGVTISDKELDKNGESITGTIYDKTNKNLTGKKLKEKINDDISREKSLQKAKQEADKALTKALIAKEHTDKGSKAKGTTSKTTSKGTTSKGKGTTSKGKGTTSKTTSKGTTSKGKGTTSKTTSKGTTSKGKGTTSKTTSKGTTSKGKGTTSKTTSKGTTSKGTTSKAKEIKKITKENLLPIELYKTKKLINEEKNEDIELLFSRINNDITSKLRHIANISSEDEKDKAIDLLKQVLIGRRLQQQILSNNDNIISGVRLHYTYDKLQFAAQEAYKKLVKLEIIDGNENFLVFGNMFSNGSFGKNSMKKIYNAREMNLFNDIEENTGLKLITNGKINYDNLDSYANTYIKSLDIKDIDLDDITHGTSSVSDASDVAAQKGRLRKGSYFIPDEDADKDATITSSSTTKLEDSEMSRLFKRRLKAEAALKASEMGDEYEELKDISTKLSNIRSSRDAKNAEELLTRFKELREKVQDHLDMDPDPNIFKFNGSMSTNPEDIILYQAMIKAENQYYRTLTLANWNGPKEIIPKQIPINNAAKNIEEQLPEEAKPKKRGGLLNGALGWAVVGARVTGYVLNHGKDVINVFGNQAVKFKEDKGVIAQMTFIVSNGKNADTKFQDTKFSVRFDINDLSWHATNLDNRKMKFDEQKIIDIALNSAEGKKFKQNTINRWKKLFKGKTKTGNTILTYIINNASQFKLDKDKKLLETLKKININFDKIEQQFS